MKSLTVRLPESLVADIEAESRGRKLSKSDVVRERLSLAPRRARRRSALADAIEDLVGSVDGLPSDLSARRKTYLKRTGYGRKRRHDAGFVVALLSRRDGNHRWAATQPARFPPPWSTCEAVLSEAFHLVGRTGRPPLSALLRRRVVVVTFDLGAEFERVLGLMERYADVPMSLADGCLVRMTEALADPVLLTTDTDFRIYRRHSRQAIPCVMPT